MRVSAAALRRYIVAAQGFGAGGEVEDAIGRLSAVQLDSIATVERSHRIVLGSRVGAYPRDTIDRLLGEGRIFEYWAHEKCLLPIVLYPHFRLAMVARGRAHWYELTPDEQALTDEVLAAVRERGPVTSRDFERGDETTLWKAANRVLNALWNDGVLAVAGRRGFERVYDLPERVVPPEVLDGSAPSEEESVRALALRAVRGRGAQTAAAIVEHWRWNGGVRRVRPALDALVREGALDVVDVDDGGPPLYVEAGAELDGDATGSFFLSPFDNLLWDRKVVERLFGFRHVIEIYKRAPERRYGYYVLPLLAADRIVGRADLKTDRKAGKISVLAFHAEPRVRGAKRALGEALSRLTEVACGP